MLNELIKTKEDIKNSIINKGGVVEGGMTTYADAIRNLNVNELNIDWSPLGYTEEEIDIIRECLQKRINQEIGPEKYIYETIIAKRDSNELNDDFKPFQMRYGNYSVYGKNVMFPPLFDTSKYTDFGIKNSTVDSFFAECSYAVCCPNYDIRSIKKAVLAFTYCSALGEVHLQYPQSLTSARMMFGDCSLLKRVTLQPITKSYITDWHGTFNYCTSLEEAPELDLSVATNTEYMFMGCSSMNKVPLYDLSNVENCGGMFHSCESLTDVAGFPGLGKKKNFSSLVTFIDESPNLTRESIRNIFNNLYDRKTAGFNSIAIWIRDVALERCEAADIAIATKKGWYVAGTSS